MIEELTGRYADAAADNIRRNIRLIYLVAISLVVVISTSGRTIAQLQERYEALYFASRFSQTPPSVPDSMRDDYGKYAAERLGVGYDLLNGSFLEYRRDKLNLLDAQFISSIYTDVPLQCLEKFTGTVNELLLEVEEKTLFSDSSDLVVAFEQSVPARDIIQELVGQRRVTLLDSDALENATYDGLYRLLNTLPSPEIPQAEPFPQDGDWNIFTEGSPPYAVDPTFSARPQETVRLESRELVEVMWPFKERFCTGDFKLIDSGVQVDSSFLQLRLRFSNSRPELGGANAFEDSITFSVADSLRWPSATDTSNNNVNLIWNEYGDLYVLMRAPVIEGIVDGSLAWVETLPDYSRTDIVDRMKEIVAEIELGEQPDQSFDLALRGARANVERAKMDASVGVSEFRLPVKIAIPVIGVVQILCLITLIQNCRGLRRDVVIDNLPQRFFEFQTGIAFHPSRLCRQLLPVIGVIVAGGAAIWAYTILDIQGAMLYLSALVYAVALLGAIYAGRQMAAILIQNDRQRQNA